MPKNAKDLYDPETIEFINGVLSLSENTDRANEYHGKSGTYKEDVPQNLSSAQLLTRSSSSLAGSRTGAVKEDFDIFDIIKELEYLEDYHNILTLIESLPPDQVPTQVLHEMHNGTAGSPSKELLGVIREAVVIDKKVKYPCINFRSGEFKLDVLVDSQRLRASFASLEEAVVGYIYVKKLAEESPNTTEYNKKTFNAALDQFEGLRRVYDNFEKHQKEYPAVIKTIDDCYKHTLQSRASQSSKRLRH